MGRFEFDFRLEILGMIDKLYGFSRSKNERKLLELVTFDPGKPARNQGLRGPALLLMLQKSGDRHRLDCAKTRRK